MTLQKKTDDTLAFIADCHLGKVAKYLRIMGFDTLYFTQIEDDALIALAQDEGRIILTRDRLLSERKHAPAILLRAVQTHDQLLELMRALKIIAAPAPFSRCIVCNTPLQVVDKESIEDRLPEKVKRYFDTFQQCPSCGRVYWQGDHYRHMKTFVDSLFRP